MALETEKKYLGPDLDRIRISLSRGGAAFQSRAWEKNLVLDTRAGSMRRENTLLRLRHAEKTTLTLKKKPHHLQPTAQRVKTLEEWETTVGDKAAMLAILERLGFVVASQYEKIREIWQWGKCTICLDTLPFMEAVEIEGGIIEIDQAALHFQLDGLETSTKSYHQLFQEYRKSLGMVPADDCVFSEDQKAKLMTMLSANE